MDTTELDKAKAMKELRNCRMKLVVLQTLRRHPERIGTASEMSAPGIDYRGDTGFVGGVFLSLRKLGLIERIGQVAASRPLRNGAEIKLWKLANDAAADGYVRTLADRITHLEAKLDHE